MEKRIFLASPHMSEEGYEKEYIKEAFDTNWIAPLGENVNKFEEELAHYVGAKYGAAFVSGALIGMIPLVFDFLLTAMVFPMVIPQVGTGTFPVAAMDIMSGVFYTHPLVYNLIFVLIDGCFWGLLNCAVLWAVNFVRNRFWILLTPFIIYIFVFCMVHFVNRVSLSPVMFLRPSAPFRNDIRVVICAFIILIVVNIIFYIHAVKKELVAYE